MTKSIWPALALALAAFGPAACGADAPAEAEPGKVAGIEVTNAKLMLPAVAGNPGAVYFDIANISDENKMIRAVAVKGAGNAQMHMTTETGMAETLQMMVEQGKTTKFETGGNHIMAMDLADTVKAGGTTDVTLTFVGGSSVTFPAEVHAAGDER
jgi:copper(I)-binding protein